MRIEDAPGGRRAGPYMRRKVRRMNEQTADLLPRVATAHELMHRVVDLQNRINQLTTQFAAKTEKKSKRHPVLYAIAGFLIAFALITSTPLKAVTYPFTIPFFTTGGMELQVTVWNVINLAVSAVIGAVLYKVIAKSADKSRAQKNAAIDRNNAQVEANNQALAQSIEQTKREIFTTQQRWAAEVAPWYPMDYDSIDAVDFFLTAVRNHRASTVQEMVNLYETERHQRRMEQGQQQIHQQQRIGNMLQLGNLFMQGQILNQAQQINANTASASSSLDWISNAMGRR